MPAYNDEQLQQIEDGLYQLNQEYQSFLYDTLQRTYCTERGREYALHGLTRRLYCMNRSIEIVYEKLPPDLDEPPENNDRLDATIAIHSFVQNTFGCLDNLAWIWVSEKPVIDADGNELRRERVGFARRCREVRRTLSDEFIRYIDSRQNWIDRHLKDFRDALAHRIPLYIPPYCVRPEDGDRYNTLDEEKHQALRSGNLERYEELISAQEQLHFWKPVMTHSFFDNSPIAGFHPQLIADFRTVIEFGNELYQEFVRHEL